MITLEAGWVVTEVGRQPWIVRNYMKVEDAATGNTGVWITFLAVLAHLRGRRRDAGAGAPPHESPAEGDERSSRRTADGSHEPEELVRERGGREPGTRLATERAERPTAQQQELEA